MPSIAQPAFPGDDGSVSAEVAAALTAYAADPDHRHAAALAVLQHSRLLVPVVAVLGEVDYDDAGRPREKTSDMAAVLMQGRDGRTALLGFTGTEPMRRWNPEARPVQVRAADAARAALQDHAAALVLDIAGPTMFVVEEDDLQALADGLTLVEVSGGYGWVRPVR
jgi:hypothetical protein